MKVFWSDHPTIAFMACIAMCLCYPSLTIAQENVAQHSYLGVGSLGASTNITAQSPLLADDKISGNNHNHLALWGVRFRDGFYFKYIFAPLLPEPFVLHSENSQVRTLNTNGTVKTHDVYVERSPGAIYMLELGPAWQMGSQFMAVGLLLDIGQLSASDSSSSSDALVDIGGLAGDVGLVLNLVQPMGYGVTLNPSAALAGSMSVGREDLRHMGWMVRGELEATFQLLEAGSLVTSVGLERRSYTYERGDNPLQIESFSAVAVYYKVGFGFQDIDIPGFGLF